MAFSLFVCCSVSLRIGKKVDVLDIDHSVAEYAYELKANVIAV